MTNNPRILWLAHTAPGPRLSGAPVYTGGLVEAVARAGARVTFLGLRHPDGNGAAPGPFGEPERDGLEWRIVDAPERGSLHALASRLPLVASRASPPAIGDALRTALADGPYDAVIFDNYAAGWALDLVEAADGGRIVYVAHNDETRLAADIADAYTGDTFRRIALDWNARKVRRLEDRLLRSADLLVTLTEADRDSLRSRTADCDALVLPPGYTGTRVSERRITDNLARRAVMVGSVRWIAKRMNVAAFLEEADALFALAGVTLDIIGDVPDDFRAEWEPRLAATRFRGFVDDLAAEMADARLGLVVEATGGGFKLKTLDYIFHRVPVAALAGSCAGLPARVTDAFVLADDATALAEAAIRVIDDVDRLDGMQSRAFAAAEGAFDWNANGQRLVAALRRGRTGMEQAA